MKVCLVVDKSLKNIDFWYHALFRAIENQDVTFIILRPQSEGFFIKIKRLFVSIGFFGLLSRISFRMIEKIEFFLFRSKINQKSLKFPSEYNLIYLNVFRQKHYWCMKTRSKECNLDYDFSFYLGTHLLSSSIINLFQNGLLSLHHGDPSEFRGGPPGFWEVYYKKPSTKFILQKLSVGVDSGTILLGGSTPTSYSWTLNMYYSFIKSVSFVVLYLNNHTSHKDNLPKLKIYNSKIYKVPNIYFQINYMLYLFKFFIVWFTRKVFSIKPNWFVGFTRNTKDISFYNSSIIPNPNGGYYADPFVIQNNTENYLFVEKFIWTHKKGVIDCFKISESSLTHLGTVLESEHHLSFPYVFKYNDNFYMTPEQYQSCCISLYQSLEFPYKWTKISDIKTNINAVDPIVFFFNGIWWLLCNVDSSDLNEHCSELHLFYSRCLFSSDWKSHSSNPVISDSQQARNGGFFVEDNLLYRVFQYHKIDNYGYGFGISHICEITIDNYEEKVIHRTCDKWFKGAVGGHTFNRNNKLSVFDYYKFCR